MVYNLFSGNSGILGTEIVGIAPVHTDLGRSRIVNERTVSIQRIVERYRKCEQGIFERE